MMPDALQWGRLVKNRDFDIDSTAFCRPTSNLDKACHEGSISNALNDDWVPSRISNEEHRSEGNRRFLSQVRTLGTTTSLPDFLVDILDGGKTGRMTTKWCKRFKSECLKRMETGKGTPTLRSRIIGGITAAPKKHKYMVLIGYGNSKRNRQWNCGGSLISERYVLTAAHCTEGGLIGEAKWARVGELDLSTDSEDAKPQDRTIVDRIRHPEYKEPAVYNDIALLKLDADVVFNEWVSPICLQTSKNIANSRATVAGWGRVDFISETSPTLLEVNINIFNSSECRRLTGNDTQKLPRGIDTEKMLCAGEIQGGKDACSGDSGGPLFWEEGDCSTTQIGITSMGRDCGLPNSPGVYTNVVYYIPWIESTVWGDESDST